MKPGDANIQLDAELTKAATVNANLAQDVIITNTDKVRILLTEHHNIIKRKMDWVNPLGAFITVLATLLTAEFKATSLGLSAPTWHAIFVLSGVGTFILLTYYILNALMQLNHGTVEEFIRKLKNNDIEDARGKEWYQFFKRKKPIEIHKCLYTSGRNWADVTLRVKELVDLDVFEFVVNNEFLGAEPNTGSLKTLSIDYTINGILKKTQANEHEIIKLL